jgi:hypothetical protein
LKKSSNSKSETETGSMFAIIVLRPFDRLRTSLRFFAVTAYERIRRATFMSPESKLSIVLRQTRLESRATVGGYFLPKRPSPADTVRQQDLDACLGTISTKSTFRFGIAAVE